MALFVAASVSAHSAAARVSEKPISIYCLIGSLDIHQGDCRKLQNCGSTYGCSK
jgi:hypothetical protein